MAITKQKKKSHYPITRPQLRKARVGKLKIPGVLLLFSVQNSNLGKRQFYLQTGINEIKCLKAQLLFFFPLANITILI